MLQRTRPRPTHVFVIRLQIPIIIRLGRMRANVIRVQVTRVQPPIRAGDKQQCCGGVEIRPRVARAVRRFVTLRLLQAAIIRFSVQSLQVVVQILIHRPMRPILRPGSRGAWRTTPLSLALPNAYFDSLGIPRLTASALLNSPNRRMRTRTSAGVGGQEL